MATMEEMLAWLGDRCHVLSLTKIGPDLWQCAAISTDGTRHAVGRDESAHRAVLDVFEDLGGPSRRDRK